MKKLIFVAGAMVIAAAVSAAVCLNFGQTRHNDLFEQNLEALAQLEGVTGIGRMCAYEPLNWCVYLDPYEIYEGIFVSDIVIP